jgi:hypothetical protein
MAAFDNEVPVYVPTEIQNHIQLSYLLVPDGLVNENPVKKVQLVVSGLERDELCIDEIPEIYEDGAGEEGTNIKPIY